MSLHELNKMAKNVKNNIQAKINNARQLTIQSITDNTTNFSELRKQNINMLKEVQQEIEQLMSFKQKIADDVPRDEIRNFVNNVESEIDKLKKVLSEEVNKSESHRSNLEAKKNAENERKHKEVTAIVDNLHKNTGMIVEKMDELEITNAKGRNAYQKEIIDIKTNHDAAKLDARHNTNYLAIAAERFSNIRDMTAICTENTKHLKHVFNEFDKNLSTQKKGINSMILSMKRRKVAKISLSELMFNYNEAANELNNFNLDGLVDVAKKAMIDEQLKTARDAMRSFKTSLEKLIAIFDDYSENCQELPATETDQLYSEAKEHFDILNSQMDEIQKLVVGLQIPSAISHHTEAALTYNALKNNTIAKLAGSEEANKEEQKKGITEH